MGTELCERFSFYGLRSILITFLTGQLGQQPSTAESVFHAFTAGCYLMPLAGAYIADRHLGRYRTILFFSLFYCLGHGTIAAFDTLAVRPAASSDAGCHTACDTGMQASRSACQPCRFHLCSLLHSGSRCTQNNLEVVPRLGIMPHPCTSRQLGEGDLCCGCRGCISAWGS